MSHLSSDTNYACAAAGDDSDIPQYYHGRHLAVPLPVTIISLVIIPTKARGEFHARFLLLWPHTTNSPRSPPTLRRMPRPTDPTITANCSATAASEGSAATQQQSRHRLTGGQLGPTTSTATETATAATVSEWRVQYQ